MELKYQVEQQQKQIEQIVKILGKHFGLTNSIIDVMKDIVEKTDFGKFEQAIELLELALERLEINNVDESEQKFINQIKKFLNDIQ